MVRTANKSETLTREKPKKKLRKLEPPQWVSEPSACSIRTRIKGSERDFEVLEILGDYLGHLANLDLTWAQDNVTARERKKRLTMEANARWANSIMAETDRRIKSERTNRWRHLSSIGRAISCINKRLNAKSDNQYYKPYLNASVAGLKIIRRQNLIDRLNKIKTSPISIVRGGHALWQKRQNLKATGLTLAAWQAQWQAARMFLSAKGSKDESFGNCTMQVNPETGICSIALPASLAKIYANSPDGKHYILDAKIEFFHRQNEWLGRAQSKTTEAKAITYTISHRFELKGRWYLDAAWTYQNSESPAVHPKLKRRLGVDLNADHLAVWPINNDGNPVGKPSHIPLNLKGLPSSTKDGRICWAISQMLKLAVKLNADLACENLGWADQTGRDDQIQGRAFRKTCAGFPTAKFRKYLTLMAHNAGVSIVIVDPAYTSQWGQEHWGNFQVANHQTTSHEAAAIVISRRSQGQSARRRTSNSSSLARREQRAAGVQCDRQPKALTQDQSTLDKLWVQGPDSRGQPPEPKPRHTTQSLARERSLVPVVFQNSLTSVNVNSSEHFS